MFLTGVHYEQETESNHVRDFRNHFAFGMAQG